MIQLYLKTLFYDKRKYYMVFLSNIMAVSMVFMFNVTVNSPIFDFSPHNSSFKSIMGGITGALSIFLIFLIVYGFSALFAERKKESNIFISLGVSRIRLFVLMCVESLLIFLVTFLLGVVLGVLLSSIVVFIISTLYLEQAVIHIAFSFDAFQKSGVLVIISLLIVTVRNYFIMVRADTNAASKVNLKLREFMKLDYVLCFSGVAVFFVTLYRQYLLGSNGNNNVFQTVLFATIGIFLFIYSLGGILIKYAGWKTDLLMLSHLRTNYINYAKLMTSMTLLVLLGVYLLGLTTIYFDERDKDELLTGKIYDLVYYTPITEVEPELVGISQNDIVEKNEILLSIGVFPHNGDEFYLISEADYTQLTGKVLNLNDNTVQLVSQMPQQESNWIWLGTQVQFDINNQQFNFTLRGETWEYLFDSQYERIFILNNDDFQKIDENALMRGYFIFLQDWTLGKDVSLKNKDNPEIINIISKYDQYLLEVAEQNSLLFFLTLAVAVFFVSLGYLLYYKISSDIPSVMERNHFLQNIGVCIENIKKSTKINYGLFFIIPTAIGVFYGSALVFIFTYSILKRVSYQIFIVAFVFTISQYVFYKYTMKKLVSQE